MSQRSTEHDEHDERGEEAVRADEPSAAAEAVPPEDGAEQPVTGMPDLTGARVLVVEDETPVANFVTEVFAGAGAQVVHAADGARGLELFHSEQPDLVLCDLLLPKRNGFQLLEEMATSSPDTPVVVMSGVYRSDSYREEVAHARLFLDKPLAVEALVEAARLGRERLDATGGRRETGERRAAARGGCREPWVPTRLVPLARVLHLLWKDGRTGLLTHRCGERRTVFMLQRGAVHFVRCNDPELALGRILVQLGKVRAEDLETARAALAERVVPTRLGEVLVELGLLQAADLRTAVQLQLRKIIAGAFGETDGQTLFHADAEASEEDIAIDTDTRAVIVAGCAAIGGEAEQLLGHLPDGDCRVLVACDPEDPQLKLPAAERRLLEAVDGPTRLADVLAMAQLMGLRPRPLIFGLLCAEVLRVADAGREWDRHAPRAEGGSREVPDDAVPAALLLDLEREGLTGTVTVEGGSGRSWLALDGGRLCGAGSEDARSRLGERLRASGLITDEQLQAALEVKEQCPRKPLGRILVEMGSLEPAQLIHAVRAQALGIATELLSRPSWSRARIDEDRLPDIEPVDVGLSTSDVVLEGLRRTPVARLERLAGRLSAGRPELELEALRSGRFSLTDTEESVVGALSGATENLLRSLTSADESDPDVIRMVVAALLLTPAAQPVEAA
jgi:DNA-binding response OmpR family regulator